MDKQQFVTSLEHAWSTGSRWKGVTRPYTAADVYRLRGSIDIEYSLARFGAARLWQLFQDEEYVAVLSAITGNQAIQQVQAGLKAIYVSGWQVAADANNALEMYPDQSLYPSDSVPALLRRLNNALKRADRRQQRDAAHDRLRRVRSALRDRRADRGRVLPGAGRRRGRHRAGARVCTVCRFALVRDVEAGSRGSDQVRRGDPRQIPGQDARVPLPAVA